MRSGVYKDWISFLPNNGFDLSAHGTLTFTVTHLLSACRLKTISYDFPPSPTSPIFIIQLPRFKVCVFVFYLRLVQNLQFASTLTFIIQFTCTLPVRGSSFYKCSAALNIMSYALREGTYLFLISNFHSTPTCL